MESTVRRCLDIRAETYTRLTSVAITHPKDPRIRGLAAAILESNIPCWEFDIRAVEPGTDPLQVSDWERRGRIKRGNSAAGAEAIAPLPKRSDGDGDDHG